MIISYLTSKMMSNIDKMSINVRYKIHVKRQCEYAKI